MSENSQVEKLVEEGIAAAKSGDKQLARGKLEMAVKLDQYSEQGWFWLASVVETDEERRTCLGNVIIINPQNERAQQMLDRLEGRAVEKRAKADAILGMPRRQAMMAGGIVLLIVVLLCILLNILGGGDDLVVPTAFTTSTSTSTPDEAGTATALATITPTITLTFTPTRASVSSIATWTATPGPTDTPTLEPLPSLPSDLPGRIIMQSGGTAAGADNLPIFVIPLANIASKIQVSTEGQRGQNPALAPGRNRFVWAQYASGQRTLTLQIQNFGIAESVNVASLFDSNAFYLNEPNEPNWQGNRIAFSAQLFGATTRDLWMLEVAGVEAPTPVPAFGAPTTPTDPPPPTAENITPDAAQPPESSPLTRLTNAEAEVSYPAFDPTGSALVYVASSDGQTDLRIVNVNSLQIGVLTSNGNELVESAPDWAVYNGANEIVFAASQGETEETDIYLMQADGSAAPELLFSFGPHDIKPRFSPDGKYIVFSSDRNGNWDVFIYNRETKEFYAIETNPQTVDIANDWTE